jgi:hypothetical protein
VIMIEIVLIIPFVVLVVVATAFLSSQHRGPVMSFFDRLLFDILHLKSKPL